MLKEKIIHITGINFVNYHRGNPVGSHTEFEVNNMYYHQLLYKCSGEAVIHYGNKTVTERANDLRLLPGIGIFQSLPYYAADVIAEGESINIGFFTDRPIADEITVKHYENTDKLKLMFTRLSQIWYYKKEGYYYECLSVLYAIFAEISKNEANYLYSGAYHMILPAVEYIDSHFTEIRVDYEILAALCGISYPYLTKLFNRIFSVSPCRYVQQKKIDYACDLLKAEQYSMKKIAEMSGFASEYYFSRVFKKIIGVSPNIYLNR